MPYPDRYVKASFRGVSFFTESHTTTFGRRVATYELPFDSKGVAHFDLGRSARKYDLKAILHGDNYDKDRDALIDALEKPGPGLLIHPVLGRAMVVIQGNIQITESTERGGVAEISFNAVESRDPLPAKATGGLLDSITAAKDAAADSWVEQLVTEGPDFVLQGVTDDLDSVIRDLHRANALVTSITSAPSLITDRIDAISRELDQLIQTPRILFDAIDNAILALMAAAGRVLDTDNAEDLYATLSAPYVARLANRLATIGSNVAIIPSRDTPARIQQRKNRATILGGVRASVVASAAQQLATVPPASRDSARTISSDLSSSILDLVDGTIEGEGVEFTLYDALKDLVTALQGFLLNVAGSAAATRAIVLSQPLPAVVLAWRLYGDADRADEIAARNPAIPHAGALPTGYEIEVTET
jgi:prophage DNA circulation protein